MGADPFLKKNRFDNDDKHFFSFLTFPAHNRKSLKVEVKLQTSEKSSPEYRIPDSRSKSVYQIS